MNEKPWALVLVLVALMALVAACDSNDDGSDANVTTTVDSGDAGPSSNVRGNVNGTLEIGKLLPQTGDQSARFKAVDTPVNMAIQEINAAGGVNGRPIKVFAADDGTSADVATVSLDRLLNANKVDVVIGPSNSATMLGIMDQVKSGEAITCSGSNTAGELTDRESGGYYLRTSPPDKFQGPALAQLVTNDGRSRIAVVTRHDSYGEGFGSALESAFREQDVDVVFNDSYDPTDDFKSIVGEVKAAKPDAVIVIGLSEDGGRVLRQLIAQGLGPHDIPTYTADGMQGKSFYKDVDPTNPASVQGIKGTAPSPAPAGRVHPFAAKYAKTGQDTIFSSHYYDCTMIVALAAEAAGTDDPGLIRKQILAVSKGGETCQTYAECLALLKAGTDIDYDGASGPVDLDEHREPTVGVYDVWEYNAAGAPVDIEGVAQIKIGG
jgi:branched-chain amino acid transport system substrate-binding protein